MFDVVAGRAIHGIIAVDTRKKVAALHLNVLQVLDAESKSPAFAACF